METIVINTLEFLKGQSIQVAIVFAAVLILTWLFQNKSAHVRYLLWLLVAIKCLTPPLVIFTVPVLPAETIPVIVPTQSMSVEHKQPPVTLNQTFSEEVSVVPDKPRLIPQYSIENRKPKIENVITSTGVLLSVWAAGAVCYLLWALGKAVRLAVYLRRIRRPLPAQLMIEQIEMLARLWNYPGGFNVWLVDGINQPFVWGLWRGAIYLPTRFQNIQGDKQKAIVLHEMAHVVRFDAFVNLIQILIQGVFWFHPLVWLANRAIRQEREKCCDEIAVARLGTAPKEYGSAIVDTLLQEVESTMTIPTLAVAGPVKNIEDRIKTIMQPGRRFFRRPSTIALFIIGCLAALVVPTTIALTQKITPPDYTLSGIVTDANDRPIAGAIVFDDGYGPQPYQKGITDENGRFEYKSWNEEHNIAAKAEGYQQQTMTFTTFPLDNSKKLNFKMQKSPNQQKSAIRIMMEMIAVPNEEQELRSLFDQAGLKVPQFAMGVIQGTNPQANPDKLSYGQFMFLSSQDRDNVIKAIRSNSKIRILTSPKAIVASGEEATMEVSTSPGLPKRVSSFKMKPAITKDGVLAEFNILYLNTIGTEDDPNSRIVSQTTIQSNILIPQDKTLLMISPETFKDQNTNQKPGQRLLFLVKTDAEILHDEPEPVQADLPKDGRTPVGMGAFIPADSSPFTTSLPNGISEAVLLPEYLESHTVLSLKTGAFIPQQQADQLKEPYLCYSYTFPPGGDPRNYTIANIPENCIGVETGKLDTGKSGWGSEGQSVWAIQSIEQLSKFEPRMKTAFGDGPPLDGVAISPPLDRSWPCTTAFKGDDGTHGIFEITKVQDRKIYVRFKTFNQSKTSMNFTATLPNGVMVELLGICEHPSEGKQWWKPDGNLLDKAPYNKMQTSHTAPGLGEIAREAAVKVDGVKDGIGFRSGVSNSQGSGSCDIDENLYALSFAQKKDATQTDIHIGIASGAWKTMATQKADFSGVVSTNNIIWHGPAEKNGNTVLHFAHELVDKNVRVVAVGFNGKEYTGGGSSSQKKGLESVQATFYVRLSKIKEFQFQTRPYEWVTFKNVSLQSGQKTDVKIETLNHNNSSSNPDDFKKSFKTITGIVKDNKGQPTGGGIKVSALPMTNAFVYTDNEGWFVINWSEQWEPSSRLRLMAQDTERKLAKIIDITTPTSTTEITLEPAIDIRGTIADKDGKAVAGAAVTPRLVNTMKDTGWADCFMAVQVPKTDDHGAFLIKALPAGEYYSLSVKAHGFKDRDRWENGGEDAALDINTSQTKTDVTVSQIILEKEELLSQPGQKAETIAQNLPFTASLPNGVTVELIGLCEYPSKDKQWWAPDGSPLPMQITTQDNINYQNKYKPFEFAYRIVIPEGITFGWPKMSGSISQSGLVVLNHPEMEARRNHLDVWGNTTKISFPIAAGPWKTLGTPNGKGQTNVSVGNRKLMFSTAVGNVETLSMTVSDNLKEFDDYRLIAFDKQGKLYPGNRNWFSVNNMRQSTFTFTGLDPESVDRYEFQTRPFSNIEFKNVSLKPGKKTDVKIEIPEDLKKIAVTMPEPPAVGIIQMNAKDTSTNETPVSVETYYIQADEAVLKQAGININKTYGAITTISQDPNYIKNRVNNMPLEQLLKEDNRPDILDDQQFKQFLKSVQADKNTRIIHSSKSTELKKERIVTEVYDAKTVVLEKELVTEPYGLKCTVAERPKRSIYAGVYIMFWPPAIANENLTFKMRVFMSDFLEPDTKQMESSVHPIQVAEIPYQTTVPNGKTFWILGPEGYCETLPSVDGVSSDRRTAAAVKRRSVILIKPTIVVREEAPPQPQLFDGAIDGKGQIPGREI